jgi:hypothetical protein
MSEHELTPAELIIFTALRRIERKLDFIIGMENIMAAEIDDLKAAVTPLDDLAASVKAVIHELAVKFQQQPDLAAVKALADQVRHNTADIAAAVLEGTSALHPATPAPAPATTGTTATDAGTASVSPAAPAAA